jgi:hypothetical protein
VTGHRIARSTHTPELEQLHQLNDELKAPGAPVITAARLGLAGSTSQLPDTAVLRLLRADGPPDFPYVHGHFTVAAGGDDIVVTMHTQALRTLSRLLDLRQRWGTDG